jgi:AAA domain
MTGARREWIEEPSEEWQLEHPDWNSPEDAEPKEKNSGNGHDKTHPDTALAAILAAHLDIHTWGQLDVPKEERLLGELITPGTRTFLIGTTGVGKTLFGYELVAAMASGTGFLHWPCDRASRWLVVDGEMPTPLIKMRINAIRARHNIPPGDMLLYSAGRAEEIAKLVPGIGEMPPLNTKEGHAWVVRVATILKVEGILFDNLMSLSPGNHAEPDTWLDTQPLVSTLSNAGITQIWCDHTGWDASRQYGTSTKAWRFDTAGVMKPLPDDQRQPNETAFTLTFEPPGKARRRTPENWRDFQTHLIRFAAGRWTSEQASEPTKLTPEGQGWLKDITNAFAIPDHPQPRTVIVNGLSTVRLTLFRNEIREHLRHCGRIGDESHGGLTDKDRSKLSHWLNKLKDSGKLGIAGDLLWLT